MVVIAVLVAVLVITGLWLSFRRSPVDALSIESLSSDPVLMAVTSKFHVESRSDVRNNCQSGVADSPYIDITFASDQDSQQIVDVVGALLNQDGWAVTPPVAEGNAILTSERLNSGYKETASLRKADSGATYFELSSVAKKLGRC
jgi:hypothetical protein